MEKIGHKLRLLATGAVSVAGLVLAVLACKKIDQGEWSAGLTQAGWSLYLVLIPFINFRALSATRRRSLSDNVRDKSLQLLPPSLAMVSMLALAILLTGQFLRFSELLRN